MLERIRALISEISFPQLTAPAIGLAAIIDILIVAYMVYFVLQWIRQTRAWSLFKGLIFILGIAVTAYLLELTTVLWITENAFAMGLVVVVVLFQPELRKALEQIGRRRIFSSLYRGGAARISHPTINEVVKAAKEMSAARTGALMVLELEVALGDHERTGIPVDAVVSSQLLINIFEKNTPLHDGAVIIRNNRVTAAACILPLTALDVSHDLGTRHRAALGISEVSDALVLVVSEETGALSLAEGGRIDRRLTEYQLRDELTQRTSNQREKPAFSFFGNKKSKKERKPE
jgi:diadenylate cyclase